MSNLEQRYIEDRAMRDAARAVLMADIEHAKASFSGAGMIDRITDRISEGAADVFETAKSHADDNRGIIAALIGAIILWLGREPLLELFGLGEPDENEITAETGSPQADETNSGDDNE